MKFIWTAIGKSLLTFKKIRTWLQVDYVYEMPPFSLSALVYDMLWLTHKMNRNGIPSLDHNVIFEIPVLKYILIPVLRIYWQWIVLEISYSSIGKSPR